jgi:predicted HTH domain antitoxin
MDAVRLPAEIEESLRKALGRPLEDVARELLLIEAYKAGVLTAGSLAKQVGLSGSIEALQWLADRGVEMNYGVEDFEEDLRTLRQKFGRKAS